jgi:hypothetical protein
VSPLEITDAQIQVASVGFVLKRTPIASKWGAIFGQQETLAFKLYIAFWSQAEHLLVSQALFEVQRTGEYTAKTFLARVTFA